MIGATTEESPMAGLRSKFLSFLALLLVASVVTACVVEPVGPPRRAHWHGWHEWR
jgi:hypothetical protein